MVGLTLFAGDLSAAPPEVRHWLERQVVLATVAEPAPEPAAASPTTGLIGCDVAKASSGTIPPVIDTEGGSAMRGRSASSQKDEAARSAAIKKLIAERAYELWENHGRPQGSDLINWLEAEQEIKGCLDPLEGVCTISPGGDYSTPPR